MPYDPYYGTMGDEELLGLAQQAGYIPSPAPSTGTESSLAPPAPDPMAGQLTPPEPLSPAATAPGPVGSFKYGAGQSFGGYSESQAAKVQKTMPGFQGELAAQDQLARSQATPMLDENRRASEGRLEAQRAESQARMDQTVAAGKEAAGMERLQNEFAADEARINAETTAQSNQAKADYVSALMEYRASGVDPGALWKQMGRGERFGVVASAFVHDYLGAKGIHTSAMDTLNKAVDRNIDAQVAALKVKGEVAEGFKSVWYMQRNQAASDAEARSRVRGFMLEGAKQAVVAHMAPYESALVSAQGQSALAAIDAEQAKNTIEIYRHVDKRADDLRQQAITIRGQNLQASQVRETQRIQREELERKKLEDARGADIRSLLVPDVTVSGGGRARYILTNPKDETATREVKTRLGALRSFDNNMERLRKISREVGAIPTAVGRKYFLAEREREILQIADRLTFDAVKASSGAQYTDKELEQWKGQFPVNTWLTQGNTDKQLALAHAMVHEDVGARISPWVSELPEGHEYRGQQLAPTSDSLPGQAEHTEALRTFEPPPESPEEKVRRESGAGLLPENRNNPLTSVPYHQAIDVKARVDEYKSTRKNSTTYQSPGDQLAAMMGEPTEQSNVTEGDYALLRLQHAAKTDPAAYAQLVQQAATYLNGGKDDPAAVFATHLLYELAAENPDKFPQPRPFNLEPVD